MDERCPTGIEGLDELIEGGLPKGRTVLIYGSCGTGKTILATQFIYNGAFKYNEPGILVTLEQSPAEIKRDMLAFGFDLNKLESEGKLMIIDSSLSRMGINVSMSKSEVPKGSFTLLADETKPEKIVDIIVKAAGKIKAKRVVIDSIPALDFMVDDKQRVRKILLDMNYKLKEAGLTTVLISDVLRESGISMYGAEEYVVDGVIFLRYEVSGADAGRSLIIQKMRGTKHSEHIHPIEFKKGVGIRVMSA